MIHITDSQTDRILDVIDEDEFWEDKHYKSLKDTLETYDFTTFADKRFSEHLAKRNRIIIPDEDGKYIEFVIENTREYRDSSGGLYIEVYTSASYIDLAKAKVIKPQTLSNQTVSTAVSHAIGGTEWEAGTIANVGTRTFVIEEHTNPYSFLKRIASEFDLELHFRVEVDGNKVIRRYVDLVERIGMWRGREAEFGKDLIGIERKEDFSNIVTALIGLGPEREDGTRLEVFVEDEDALQRWGRPHPQTGQLMHLVETYEPESADQDMTIERLTELTRNELEKRINSIVEYNADVVDLEKVPGLQNKVIRFGDTIKIKDLGFSPPLYLEARVHTQERSLSDPANKRVILGDFIEYTEEEVQEIWRQLQAQIAKKIEMSDVLEVTYTKPEIDAKDSSVYQDSTQYTDVVAEVKKQEAIQVAAEDATQKANQAEQNAKQYTQDYTEQKKQEAIQQAVAEAEQKVNQAKTELENEIATKVDAEWVNGRLVLKENVITKSNTAPTSPTTGQLWLDTSVTPNVLKHWNGSAWVKATPTAAGEVGAYTKTEVDNALNSKVSITQYTADMNGVVTRLNSAESRITQNEQEIATKVSNTTYQQDKTTINNSISQLQTKMSNAETSITQLSSEIALKANKTDVYTKSQIDGQFNTVNQQISQLNAELSVQAGEIATKVSKTEFESLQIGGRNLLTNTESWETTSIASNSAYGIFKNNLNDLFASLLGKEVTFSFEVKIDTTDGTPGQVRLYCANGSPKYTFPQKIFSGITNQYQRVTYTTTITEISGNTGQAKIEFWGVDPKTTKIYIRYLKLERGNRATDWTPAPEDTQSQIDGLGTRVTNAETSITQLSTEISLKANQSTVDTLTGQVSSIQSQLTVMAGEISAKVEKDGIINAINVSTEGIKISGTKLHITAQTTIDNAVIKDAHIDKMSATKLTTGTINADLVSISNNKVTINSSGITVTDGDFLLKDVANSVYSILAKTNYVDDHSFETVPTTGLPNLTYYWYEMEHITAYVPTWTKIGSPKVAMAPVPVPSNAYPIFGTKAIVVNASNYVEQAIDQLSPGATYTVSAYFKRQWNTTAGAPKITISRINALGNITGTIKTATFPTVPSNYSVVRYATTFTVPSDLSNNGETVLISISSTNSNWVQCDGVQVVEGSVPVLYQLEKNLFDYVSGQRTAEWIRTRNLWVERRLNVSAPSQQIVIKETDTVKEWHIEVNNEALHFVETGVSIRMTLSPGTVTVNAGLGVSSDIEFSGAKGRLFTDTGANVGYLQTTGNEYRVTKYKSTTYIPVRASSFPTGSLAEYKEDIHPWQESALEKIRQATIYEYYLKSEFEQGIYRKRQGLVIGEGYNTPDGVIDGDGVEQYLMNAWSWKAIQELDSEQMKMKDDIEWLKLENQYLKQKIQQLEGMVS